MATVDIQVPDIKEAKELSEFSLISGNDRETQNSIIYRFINKLRKGRQLHGVNLTSEAVIHRHPGEKKAYFVITLPAPLLSQGQADPLFSTEGYVFQENHLTIDKCYTRQAAPNHSQGINVTTAAHYTAVYVHPTLAKSRRVHLYFDYQGRFSSVDVREQDLSVKEETTSAGKVKVLSPAQITQIKTDAHQAHTILNKIIDAQSKNYEKAIKKADSLEKLLTQFSRHPTPASLPAYQAAAQDFIRAIDDLNHYSPVRDPRGEVFKKYLHKVVSLSPSVSLSQPAPQPKEIPVDNTATETPGPEAPIEIHTSTEVEEAMAELKILQEKLEKLSNPESIDDHILKHQYLQETQGALLNFDLNPNLKLDPKRHQGYANYLSALKKKKPEYPDLFALFEKEILAGNLESVQKLFPHAQHQLNLKFFMKSFEKFEECIDLKNESSPHSMNSIFDFLYENSSLYHAFIRFQSGLVISGDQKGARSSLLAKFVYFLPAVESLIKQGVDPNSRGMEVDVYDKTYCFPMCVRICWYTEGEHRVRVLNFLLKHGLNLQETSSSILTSKEDLLLDMNELEKSLLEKKGKSALLKAKKKASGTTQKKASSLDPQTIQDLPDSFYFTTTCLDAAVSHDPEPQIIALLLPHFNIGQKLMSLAILLRDAKKQFLCPSTERGLKILSSDPADELFAKLVLTSQSHDAIHTLHYILEEREERTKAIELLWDDIQRQYDSLADNSTTLSALLTEWSKRPQSPEVTFQKRLNELEACKLVLILKEKDIILDKSDKNYETNLSKIKTIKIQLMENYELHIKAIEEFEKDKVENARNAFYTLITTFCVPPGPDFADLKRMPVFKRAEAYLAKKEPVPFLPSQTLQTMSARDPEKSDPEKKGKAETLSSQTVVSSSSKPEIKPQKKCP